MAQKGSAITYIAQGAANKQLGGQQQRGRHMVTSKLRATARQTHVTRTRPKLHNRGMVLGDHADMKYAYTKLHKGDVIKPE